MGGGGGGEDNKVYYRKCRIGESRHVHERDLGFGIWDFGEERFGKLCTPRETFWLCPCNRGERQGRFLSPLLFIFYLNEIPLILDNLCDTDPIMLTKGSPFIYLIIYLFQDLYI